MRKLLCILLCVCLLGALTLSASATFFQVTCYYEDIYAGGVVDMYAFAEDGVEPYTYRWQYDVSLGDGSWYDLEDNADYSGTKTSHLQLHTQIGNYEGWDVVPFRCLVTDAAGTPCATTNIYMRIYPTENLLENLPAWGYELFEPTITNASSLYTADYENYTATAYAGSKLHIICGSKAVDRAVLNNSEVTLTREIHITENGNTTKVSDQTTYIPYTVGKDAVTVELKLHAAINGYDLGYVDTKTVRITTLKPTVTAAATAKTDCSLLRYTYNESQKLVSIPKGATVEVLSKDGSYYQVFYNNLVGYVGTSLLNTREPSYDPVIKMLDVVIPAPVAGKTPAFTCSIPTEGCKLYSTDPVNWIDVEAGRFLTSTDTFREGGSYKLSVWVEAEDGYKFQTGLTGDPKLGAHINGNLPPYIYTAYEQDPEKVVELVYAFNNVKAQEAPPPPDHTCVPVLVESVEPTCTQNGHEAYYYCSCGMHYTDAQGQNDVDVDVWGVLPATGHTPSGWRYTQIVHYKACTTCGEFLEEEDHSGGTATCVEKAVCTVCGNGYAEPEDHLWSPTYLYQEAAGHAWICARCKTHSEVQAHTSGSAATEESPQTCTDCGYVITPSKNHTHSLRKMEGAPADCLHGGSIEYYACDGCSQRFADAEGKQTLSAATGVQLDPLGHSPSNVWIVDEEYHWRVCATCGAVMEETKMCHEYLEGKCATCGVAGYAPALPPAQTQPATPEPVPETTAPAAAPVIPEAPAAEPSPKAKGINWLTVVLIGSVCFSAAITATVIILKRKNRR